MKVLLTGFQPFGGEAANPSWDAVRRVTPRGYELEAVELPCEFGTSAAVLRDSVVRHAPDVVICVGQAGGRNAVTPERVAINLDDARIPDNAGRRPIDVPVVADGPAAYFATLPVKACTAALLDAGIPAAVSHTAGTFVCNHVFYSLMHLVATEFPGVRGGFVHVPYAPEQGHDDAPSLEIGTTTRALELIIRTTINRTTDLRTTAGTLH
ncbi:pyroglutamyl-peptidase I [Saccharothrix australiensis]|uniref:Pyrrolidone-carboxylate peptidase n=1 Tax=Saccharothrix australiensis TaxID=2072 RepID=A0A495VSH2_9PSEU|nr:pyroglutamyl-peptidase I [Saccharothrix australiensis]RKT52184.1 pyroglutamyl-peptidase [Saccharothrix australiensis]